MLSRSWMGTKVTMRKLISTDVMWVVLNSEPRKKPKKRGHVEGCTEILAAFHPTANLSPRPTPNPAPFSPTSQASPNPPTFPPTPNPSPSLTPNPTSNPPPSARRATSAGRVTHTSPPSVQPVVKHWEPIHPSCGEENSGVLDSIPPPSAPASPQESADSPDCVTTADFSNTIRLVSYSPAFIVTCETGDLEDGPASIIICETGNLEDGPASIIICETGNLEDGPASIIICETGNLEDGPASIIICETGDLEDGQEAGSVCWTQEEDTAPVYIRELHRDSDFQ
eukprot:XP_014054122.1 PREDICTED: keratinocyte proline-rich protein-like [Salmo salar]